MKKALCFILAVVLLIPFATSCDKNSGPIYIEGYDFVVKFGSDSIAATQINSAPEGDNVVIYTRDYMLDGKYSLTVGEAQEGRVALSIRYVEKGDTVEFDIVERTDDVASAKIPVNGFVMSVPAAQIEGVRANKGQLVDVEGYTNAVSVYERLDYASFAPDYMSSIASRRINIINPLVDIVDDKIYYIDSGLTEDVNISVDNLAVKLTKVTASSYEIVSTEKISSISAPSENDSYLVFTGEYNIEYANQILGGSERISLSLLETINSLSDVPAILMEDDAVRFDDGLFNSDIDGDGIYFYNTLYSSKVTPATEKDRVDVVFIDNMVAMIGEENARSLIPAGNGYVLSFVGEDAYEQLDAFTIGETFETCYIETTELPEMYAKIGDKYIGIDKIDGLRQPEGVSVLYTDLYGATTETNMYGIEITIVDNKVTNINNAQGDSEIPEGGYVLSLHKDSTYSAAARGVRAGDEVELVLQGPAYSVLNTKFTGTNSTRGENALIVYTTSASTGTNEYGYEIAVDENGYIVDESYSGNMKIPTNGFVLSGHGVNKDLLSSVYAVGARVILDNDTKGLTIIKTPELKIKAAETEIGIVSDKLDEAKKAFLNIEYGAINEQIDLMNDMLESAEKAFDEYDFEQAILYSNSIVQSCEALTYSMIECKTVENRAMWYRATEQSDEQVLATVEKLKMLNVNALYLETWYEGYCIASKVDVPYVTKNPAHGEFDVLESFVRICHENGIEVHSWVHDFFVGYYYDAGPEYENPVNLNPAFTPAGGFDTNKYLVDRNGKPYFFYTASNTRFVFLNPNNRENRNLVLSIYEDLITNYDIDGLHLDYIRFPELHYDNVDFGYNQDIIDGFARETGITKDPRTLNGKDLDAWIEYRCNIITSFVKEVDALVNRLGADIWMSAALYPDIPHSKRTIFQDVKGIAETGCIDEIFAMAYGADNEYVLSIVKNYVKTVKDKTFFSAGIAAFTETPQMSFALQLTEAEQAGADGIAVFALASINPSTYQTQITEGAFRKPSVQVNKFSVTAAAQMEFISNKADNISVICEVLTDDNIKFIKDKCAEIKTFADEFDLENASNAQINSWCGDALTKLDEAKTAITEACGDNDETKAIISEFEDLEYWLTLSKAHLG